MDRRGPVDLPRVIEQAIDQMSSVLGERPVSVVAEYPAHLPAVDSESSQLTGALAGLIAATVMRARHGEVVVRAALTSEVPAGAPASESRGPWALVSIAPRGNGLTGESLELMLDEAGPGEGEAVMTPAASRRAIQEMGGRVWVDKAAPEVRILLPLRAAVSPATDVSSLRRTLGQHLPEAGKPVRRLLILVDDNQVREILATELAAAGYDVVAARDGGEVLSLARQDEPDVILLDILARDPTAFDIAMVLKQDPRIRRIPVLFMTSVGDPEAGMRMGAVDFVVRPTGTGALITAIEAALSAVRQPVARILIVEPKDALRETMVLMIQAHGYRVTEAAGPEEALVLAERVQPGLVLVNAALAQDRDYWLLRGLRQISADTPVFVLAEALSEAEGKAAVRRGASGYSETDKLPDLLSRVRNGTGKP
jgi:DNA-binding response OmpR family regulator